MFCRACGQANDDGAAACSACGALLQGAPVVIPNYLVPSILVTLFLKYLKRVLRAQQAQ